MPNFRVKTVSLLRKYGLTKQSNYCTSKLQSKQTILNIYIISLGTKHSKQKLSDPNIILKQDSVMQEIVFIATAVTLKI